MRTGFLNALICILLIGLIIPGMIPGIAFAVEDIDKGSEENGNSTVDLVIESISFDPENPGPEQKKVDIITSVKNQGNGTSESTNLAYFINGYRTGESRVPEIEAGQREQISFSWEPESEEGTVEVTVKIDERELVPETNEDNNERAQSLTFAGLPDLIIDTFRYPKEAKTGELKNIEIIVKNQGTSESEGTKLKLQIDGVEVNEWDVSSLAAGENSELISEPWTPASDGPVEIKAVVDSEMSVSESNESNNQKTGTVTVTGSEELLPDLTIESFKYPENSEPGKHENIEIRVKNQGTSASEVATKLELYIGGVKVNEWDIPSLPAGESSEPFSGEWIPASEGSVEIKAVVDGGNLVNESHENNNQKADTVTVTVSEELLPDLVVEDILSEQGDPQAGKLSNLTVKIKNQGAAPAAEAAAKWYINGEAVNENLQVPALSEGANAEVLLPLTPEKAGKTEVKVLVDSGASVTESNESNNQLTKVIDVKGLLPDLRIESLFLNPETPKPGENITFTVTVKNDGAGDASSNELEYNINGINETYSGRILIPALSPGNTTSGTFSWAPGNEGQIEIKATIDAGGVVSENNESNNELTKTLTVSKETISGGSGGGGRPRSSGSSGGGGTASKEPASNVDVKELSTRHVINSYHVKFDFIENVTCVTYIEFDPKKTFRRTTTIVEVLKNKSVFVPELPLGRIYKHMNIWVGDEGAGLPGSFKNGVIEFRVGKAWIKENNVNQSLIALQWYDKSWRSLYTEKVREDRNYVYFKAETPGFSCFAITEYIVDEKSSQETEGEGKLQETLKNWNGRKAGNLNGSVEESGLIKNPMGKAKILMAISLPLFMIFVEYFILKKKI
ncbi:PGF-pre-PGF domain-containing protein [Methanosarcina sp. MSH10X1]|uniref:CARDB domain-containing protein n=1 Tax=Methanosarcina sp. MSH10X1 TaxID=2507075 RepID=UPI000FFCC021|nr:CARDB domain-containing protein [Methanosarcina sp. MSH10X1]RXA20419.1 PGF-pre-PGF domain-containing protein [Methanosarcina sp. MSH10X1]